MHKTIVLSIFLLHSSMLHNITEYFVKFDGSLDHDLVILEEELSKPRLTQIFALC